MTDGTTPPTIEAIHAALDLWHAADDQGTPMADLLLWQQLHKEDVSPRQATNMLLRQVLDLLAAEEPELTQILEMRFVNEEPGQRIAARLHMAEGTIWRKQRQGMERLVELLRSLEVVARAERRSRFSARFETPTYDQLFGADRHLAALLAQFRRPGSPWLIGIEGIGGIGKTALADALARRLVEEARWHDFAWVTARQQVFNGGGAVRMVEQPALTAEALTDQLMQQLLNHEVDPATLSYAQKQAMLQRRMREHAHLLVIDNLETLVDIEHLLGFLRTLVNPSKILLTSRTSRFHETDIFHFVVPELAPEDALALLRREGTIRNLPALAQADDDTLLPAVQVVGGNPLALRLVAGQLHTRTLTSVLDDLRLARGEKADEIYTYIYRQIWDDLSEIDRRVLLLMPLAPETGAELDFLCAVAERTHLRAEQVSDALDHLAARNLVDSRGSLDERRYSIHGLTRSFLHRQVLQWPEPIRDPANVSETDS